MTMMASKDRCVDSSNGEFRRFPRTPSEDMLSKSLGTASFALGGLDRHVSDVGVTSISYAGYLLKRSNHPHRSISPFPVASQQAPESPTEQLGVPLLGHRLASHFQDAVDAAPHVPQHQAVPNISTDSSTVLATDKALANGRTEKQEKFNRDPVEASMQFAAIFFGIDLPELLPPVQEEIVTDASPLLTLPKIATRLQETAKPPTKGPHRSAPIRMTPPSLKQTSDTSLLFTDSSSSYSSPVNDSRLEAQRSSVSDCSQPSDFIDQKDGHIWRAKFCVLEDGALYFYKHEADAESAEAQNERKHPSQPQPSPAKNLPLGCSPIPTKLTCEPVLWEKRVALECVGAVRSAELEYGDNSFELIAEDDEDNRLVLRAQNAEQMNEWLFQFHRSIATFVREFMDHMPFMEIIQGEEMNRNAQRQSAASPQRLAYDPSLFFSPRILQQSSQIEQALSHGHGRNRLHRRKATDMPEANHRMFPLAASSVPNTHMFPRDVTQQSQLQVKTTFPSVSSRLMTPDMPSPEQNFVMDDTPPPEPSSLSNFGSASGHAGSSAKYIPPHSRKQKYVPPHLRNKQSEKYLPPHLRTNSNEYVPRRLRRAENCASSDGSADQVVVNTKPAPMPVPSGDVPLLGTMHDSESPLAQVDIKSIKLGGCADPSVIAGSIMDIQYVPRKASTVGKVRLEPYGSVCEKTGWEIGAVSECGVRNSNEDAYLLVNDIHAAFDDLEGTMWDDLEKAGIFAIFDGHCGNHAARFAAEKLLEFISVEPVTHDETEVSSRSEVVGRVMERAIRSLDRAFCDLCVDGDRSWESGATAVIATVVNHHLVVTNLGDARGVLCRTVDGGQGKVEEMKSEGWSELPFEDHMGALPCLWRDVTDAHSPSREDERSRIHEANGWVTTEKEIPIGQLKRMVLGDEEVVNILKRCFADRYQPSPKATAPQRILQINRVCGELAVSRALGDRDFKASYHVNEQEGSSESATWASSLFLPYPEHHSRTFVGDLVTNQPDFQTYKVGEEGICDEFLLLACDGLWDVIDSDDAIRVTRDLLFEKGWDAKEAAARLAQLAVHLGSSDNITVIVIRFLPQTK